MAVTVGSSYLTGSIKDQVDKQEGNEFLKGLVSKIDTVSEAVDLTDNINWRDPLGWSTLRQRFDEDRLGREWWNSQLSELNDAYKLLPEKTRTTINTNLLKGAQSLGTAWEGAKTIDNPRDFFEYPAWLTAHGIELIGKPFEFVADQIIHKGLGVDKGLANAVEMLIPYGTGAALVARRMRYLSTLKKGETTTKALRRAVQAGDTATIKRILEAGEKTLIKPESRAALEPILAHLQNMRPRRPWVAEQLYKQLGWSGDPNVSVKQTRWTKHLPEFDEAGDPSAINSQINSLVNRLEDHVQYAEEMNTVGGTGRSVRYDPYRPTIGFQGNEIEFISAKTDLPVKVGLRWSWKANEGRGGYYLYNKDVSRRAARRRISFDRSSDNPTARQARSDFLRNNKEVNEMAERLLIRLLDSKDPLDQYKLDRLIGTPGGARKPIFFIEHRQWSGSAAWKKIKEGRRTVWEHRWKKKADGTPVRGGDAENMKLVGKGKFSELKTNIEQYMSTKQIGKDYYLDLDDVDNITVWDIRSGRPRQIPGYIHRHNDPSKAKELIEDLIAGNQWADPVRPEDWGLTDLDYSSWVKSLKEGQQPLGDWDKNLPLEIRAEERMAVDMRMLEQKIKKAKNDLNRALNPTGNVRPTQPRIRRLRTRLEELELELDSLDPKDYLD